MLLHGWAKLFSERLTRLRFASLLTAAGALHVTLSISINLAGRFRLLPALFDANGISAGLAFDSFYYQRKSIELVAMLKAGSFTDWLIAPFPLHVKLYSLSFAVLHPLFGFTMLSVEPLNLLYYLLIVSLVYKLGEEVFDRPTAVLAALVVSLWPSFLLHTTQLLRDALFILVTLTLVLISIRWLTRNQPVRVALLHGLVGGAASAIIWLTRYNVWGMVAAWMVIAAVLLVIRQARERRWLKGNLVGAVVLLSMMGSVPVTVGIFLQPDTFLAEHTVIWADRLPPSPSPCPDESLEKTAPVTESAAIWSRFLAKADSLAARVGKIRREFDRAYAGAGSNIDGCIRMNRVGDLLRYLPRAAANGFFAPYPDMWLARGSAVGRAGRLLSGLEMLFIYMVEVLALMGIWKGRLLSPVWLMILIVTTGIVMLGLVIANAAILFRLRYVFLMLLIILGAKGTIQTLWLLQSKRGKGAGPRAVLAK